MTEKSPDSGKRQDDWERSRWQKKSRWLRKVRTAKKRPVGGKRPDGRKRSRWWKKTGRRSPPVYRGRGPHSGEGVQKQRYENLGKWVYILIFDCGEVMKNTHSMQTTHYLLLTTHYSLLTTHYSLLTTLAPPHRKAVPSPYKQGESAVRTFLTVRNSHAVRNSCTMRTSRAVRTFLTIRISPAVRTFSFKLSSTYVLII